MILHAKALFSVIKGSLYGYRLIKEDLLKNIILIIVISALWITYNSIGSSSPKECQCHESVSVEDIPDS